MAIYDLLVAGSDLGGSDGSNEDVLIKVGIFNLWANCKVPINFII